MIHCRRKTILRFIIHGTNIVSAWVRRGKAEEPFSASVEVSTCSASRGPRKGESYVTVFPRRRNDFSELTGPEILSLRVSPSPRILHYFFIIFYLTLAPRTCRYSSSVANGRTINFTSRLCGRTHADIRVYREIETSWEAAPSSGHRLAPRPRCRSSSVYFAAPRKPAKCKRIDPEEGSHISSPFFRRSARHSGLNNTDENTHYNRDQCLFVLSIQRRKPHAESTRPGC